MTLPPPACTTLGLTAPKSGPRSRHQPNSLTSVRLPLHQDSIIPAGIFFPIGLARLTQSGRVVE